MQHNNAGARTSQARGFASKFYDILSQESSDIITWTESGQAFQVLDYTRFSEEILLKVRSHVRKNANSSNHVSFFFLSPAKYEYVFVFCRGKFFQYT